ncbi:exocyst complex component EXO70H1-like [Primulina huaijiensis]|uniref:exocyst complex component EXO70H1-like n=1 Tax=Primulina huaijiensis TaxID=1492673 RepID=UPI003CC723D3
MKNFLFSRSSSHPLNDLHSQSVSEKTHHHSFSETIMEENLDVAEAIIKKWDLDSQKHDKFSSMFENDKNEAKRFLEAVGNLQNVLHFYVKLSPTSENLIRAHNLMKIAIKTLEKEFYFILAANRKNLDSESVSGRSSLASTRSSISEISGEVSEEEDSMRSPHAQDIAMAELKSIADAMIGSGYAKECVNIYKIVRKSIIDESLYHLHVEKFTTSHIQKMDRSVLEHNNKNWLHAVKVAVKGLFYGEKILCNFIFSFSEKIAASCFAEISRDAAVNLFSFPHNFARSKKILSPEKMFSGLDMYEAISNLWPEIESIFAHESLADVRSEAAAAVARLAEALRVMLSQFEAAIQKDNSNAPVNGGVHPLTRYVMNFLVFLGDYSGLVSDIIGDPSAAARTPFPESYFSSPTPAAEYPSAASITTHLAWLILVLLCKLDGKAAHYHDVALSYLFLANNLNYVVSKVRGSNLGPLLGPDWIWKHVSKVKQYLANYEKMSWGRAMASLTEDSTVGIPEKFRNFNSELEAACKKQKSWVIPDPKMCDEIKIYFSNNISSSYRAFHEQYRSGVGAESIIKYDPEDLDNYFSYMFSMKEAPDSKRSMLYPTLSDSSILLHGG